MLKIFKLLIASFAALWTLGVVVGVVSDLGQHGGTIGVAKLAAGIGVSAACAALTWWLFTWALKSPQSRPPTPCGGQSRECHSMSKTTNNPKPDDDRAAFAAFTQNLSQTPRVVVGRPLAKRRSFQGWPTQPAPGLSSAAPPRV